MKIKNLLLICTILWGGLNINAQVFSPDKIRSGSIEDINYLAKGYLSPAGKALAVSLNNGWYSTAKAHNLGRFDLMLTPTIIFIPEYDQSFLIENSQMEALELVNGTSASSPTVFGENINGPALKLKDDNIGFSTFNAPPGVGFAFLPTTMAQLSIGLVKNTNISIRYVPQMGLMGLDEGEAGMIGFAIKHDILQWLPGGKVLPVDGSLFFGYTNLNYSQPQDDGSGNKDQQLVINSYGYTTRLLVSKKLLFFTPFAGVGYDYSYSDVKINGTFEYHLINGPIDIGKQSVKDPVAFTTEGAGGFVGNVGFRLKFLMVMSFTADYTFGSYNSLTAGAGVSLDF